MKFVVLTEPYRFEMKELSVPELKDNEILITKNCFERLSAAEEGLIKILLTP